MENLAEFYFKALEESDIPHVVLLKFYTELLDVRPSRELVIMFNKLVKLFGRLNVYFAILDISGVEGKDFSKPMYGLFSFFIQKRMNKQNNQNHIEDLTEQIKQIEKEMEESRKVPVNLPEDI